MTTTPPPTDYPTICDYLVVGGGATGMAFCDSLLEHSEEPLTVLLLDQHDAPGGQWHDSYPFVKLHQPSAGYGVETLPLEPDKNAHHLATRREILDYYDRVRQQLERNAKHTFFFVGRATFDMPHDDASSSQEHTFNVSHPNGSNSLHSVQVKRRWVDARFLQPDLPVSEQPKFAYNSECITCVPINSLWTNESADSTTDVTSTTSTTQYYVVVGGGKTGMDAVYYLLTQRHIPPQHIVWIMPHDPWITAREQIGNCMEFLNLAAQQQGNVQAAFLQWEQEGKVYRLSPDHLPTKFKDATLSRDELKVLQSIPETNMIRNQGRLVQIQDSGKLVMDKNVVIDLPWVEAQPSNITYVHCSAGAFNYTKQVGAAPVPVFDTHRITLQDVYGTPGFCFVGSLLGKLTTLTDLTDHQRNLMCRAPSPPATPVDTSDAGSVTGPLTSDHGFIDRLINLKGWLAVPELRAWLVGHRLFNLGHYASVEDMDQLVQETWERLKALQLVKEDAA